MSGVSGRRLLFAVPSGTSFLTFLRGVAEKWRDQGGAVAVACGGDLTGHDQAPWPVDVERVPIPFERSGGVAGAIRAARRLRSIVAEWRPDIVHAHFAAAAFPAALASISATPSHARWMATFHGLHATVATAWRQRLAGVAESFSAARMSSVWVLNDEDFSFLNRSLHGGIVERVPGYGVGCDLAHFDPKRFDPAERCRVRQALGIPPEAPVLIFVGRCTAFKGFDLAAKVFEEVSLSYTDVHFLAVGAIDPVHGSGLSAYEWARLRANDRVHLLGWQADVAPWLAIADLSVFPSVREGMPVNLMESLAMGVPVVTLDARGCRDVVRDRIDGVVVRDRTVTALASEVRSMFSNSDRRNAYSGNALAGRDRFARSRFVDFQVDAYAMRLGIRERQAA
jgi:glycosyltransferase involved in cell wall biosynthesis